MGDFRTVIAPATLDNLIRIRRTIPADVTTYNFVNHVRAFLQRGNCRVDDKSCGYYSKEKIGYASDVDELDAGEIFVEGEIHEEDNLEAMIVDEVDNQIAEEYVVDTPYIVI